MTLQLAIVRNVNEIDVCSDWSPFLRDTGEKKVSRICERLNNSFTGKTLQVCTSFSTAARETAYEVKGKLRKISGLISDSVIETNDLPDGFHQGLGQQLPAGIENVVYVAHANEISAIMEELLPEGIDQDPLDYAEAYLISFDSLQDWNDIKGNSAKHIEVLRQAL